MSTKAQPALGMGGTNLTLDIVEGSEVMLIRENDDYNGKIIRVHVYTPLKFTGKCQTSNGHTYTYDAELVPSNKMESMSSFPKTMTSKLQAELEVAFQKATLQQNEEFKGVGTGVPRPATFVTLGELSIRSRNNRLV